MVNLRMVTTVVISTTQSISAGVLLDRSHNIGHLVFLTKDKSMMCPYSKKLVPQSLNTLNLGWEFRVLVVISGTPIGSWIPIPFSIPKIPVGNLFVEFHCWEIEKLGFRVQKFGIQKTINTGTQYTSFWTKKMVATIPTFSQCLSCHTYIISTHIYSMPVLPHLHLLNAFPHLLNACPAIPTSTQRLLLPSRKKKGWRFSDSWNWKNWWQERIPNRRKYVQNWQEHILRSVE